MSFDTRTQLLAASLAVLLAGCGGDASVTATVPVNSSDPVIDTAQIAKIDAYVEAQRTRRHLPGLALVVSMNGKPVLEKGYGLADIAKNEKVTPDTVFRIGSVTKPFTAAAIMMLVQDGKLKLDDPVTRYLPAAPAAWRDITIRHLLTHTSGLPQNFPSDVMVSMLNDPPLPMDRVVRMAAGLPRQTAPGAAYAYNNIGYHLLGFVIENVSGMPFFEFLRERMFEPLHMNTAAMISAPLPAAAAVGYVWSGTTPRPASDWLTAPGLVEAEGGLRMSARDLAKWDAALLGGQFLTGNSLSQMHAPARLNDGSPIPYGFGWVPDEINGQPYVWHNGELGAFKAQFVRHSAGKMSVIVLGNTDGAPVEAIASRVSGIVDPALDWSVLPDPQPALGKLVRDVVDELRRGDLVVDDRFSPDMRAALTPETVAVIRETFAQWSAIESVGYLGSDTVDGVARQRYLVRDKVDEVVLSVRLDGEGRLAAFR